MDEMSARRTDEKLAKLHVNLDEAVAKIVAAVNQLHRALGERRRYEFGQQPTWPTTDTDAITATRARDLTEIAAYDKAIAARDAILGEIKPLDDLYRSDPWPRYFLCLAAGGHIHSYYRGCSTLRFDTMMWNPGLSGKPVADAVAALGERLCSVCYPDAPVEWRQDRDPAAEAAKAEREAAKAVREAAKVAKNLTPDQCFRNAYGDRVTTVAAAKEAIRDEARIRALQQDRPVAPTMFEDAKIASANARRALAARGVSVAELDEIAAKADKRARKDWAR
jgi:hypothetical protein